MEPSHGKTGGKEPVHDLENAQDPATRDATEQGNHRASLIIKKKVNKVTIYRWLFNEMTTTTLKAGCDSLAPRPAQTYLPQPQHRSLRQQRRREMIN